MSRKYSFSERRFFRRAFKTAVYLSRKAFGNKKDFFEKNLIKEIALRKKNFGQKSFGKVFKNADYGSRGSLCGIFPKIKRKKNQTVSKDFLAELSKLHSMCLEEQFGVKET